MPPTIRGIATSGFETTQRDSCNANQGGQFRLRQTGQPFRPVLTQALPSLYSKLQAYQFLWDALRDTALFSTPYLRIIDVRIGRREGYKEYEAALAHQADKQASGSADCQSGSATD